jgi:type II secretory pathway component GspD/PulD (secretin)
MVTLKKALLSLMVIILLRGVSLAAERIIEVIPVYNRPASEMQALLGPLLEDTDQVIADGSNLVVKTKPERLKDIVTLIEKLDTPLNNLIITVIQSGNTTAEQLNAANRANLNLPIKSGGTLDSHYYQTKDQNSNESTQTIRILENNTAHITVGKTYPIQDVQLYNAGYGFPAISTSTQFIDATTGFAVTPRLVEQQVILDVSPWSEKVNARNQLKSQSAQTTIRINLGEWVDLGGTDENSSSSAVGSGSTIRQTGQKRFHILVKVDKAD